MSRLYWGRAWLAKEVILLKEWRKQGIPLKEQAKRLGRSHSSIRSAVTKFKLFGMRKNNYQPELRTKVLEFIREGLTQKQIKLRLNYNSHSSISIIVKELCEVGLIKKITRLKYVPL